MATTVDRLNHIAEVAEQEGNFDSWLEMKDALGLLLENEQENEFVVYASDRYTFIHALLAPDSALNPLDVDDLMSWNCNPTSSWRINLQSSEPRSIWITPPLEHSGSRTLNQGEQLVFLRDFNGRAGKKSYYEILQKFTHILGLHYMEERQAYCRLDERGDVEDVIRIVEIPGKDVEFCLNIITFKRDVLDDYLVLTESTIVRTFDFTRYRPGDFRGWRAAHDVTYCNDGNMHYHAHIEPGYASYVRGFQLVRPMQREGKSPADMTIGNSGIGSMRRS
jgi:hypothetical protein